MSTEKDKKGTISTVDAASFQASGANTAILENDQHSESIGNNTSTSTNSNAGIPNSSGLNTNSLEASLTANSLSKQDRCESGDTLRIRNTSSMANANAINSNNNQSTIMGDLYRDSTLRFPGKSYKAGANSKANNHRMCLLTLFVTSLIDLLL